MLKALLCAFFPQRSGCAGFYPNTKRLHIRDGSTDDGNNGCDPEVELEADVPSAVRIEIRATAVEVFINDESQCQSDRTERTPHESAHVFASDPWHSPANAMISDFYIMCDSDMDTPGLQAGSSSACAVTAAAPPPPAVDVQAVIAAAGSVPGATYLITEEQALAQATELQSVDIPPDYDLGFTITPTGIVEEWASIVHVTASGENCCDYGDRIPGVCKC